MIKPAICICENKYADQLCSNKIYGFLMQRLILFQDLQCSLQIDTHTIIICKIFITQANTNPYCFCFCLMLPRRLSEAPIYGVRLKFTPQYISVYTAHAFEDILGKSLILFPVEVNMYYL